jgi:predicted patatin/cPLA2 family phospholipase
MKLYLKTMHKPSAFLVAVILIFTGCSGLTRNPVPVERIPEAVVVGMPNVRSWGGRFNPHFQADIIQSVRDEPEGEFPRAADGSISYSALALSGGGANGAFGAGFLYGWTKTGNRPKFKLVTGISTGALIAPLAFLGSDYDDTLREMYTTMSTPNIFRIQLGSEAIADTSPLIEQIEKYINESVLADVADAHSRGHRLYIGTTHLDADRIVVWNMGAIAASRHPDAPGLFRKVMLASASIPGAFPPVLIEVRVDGDQYDEMHVDGGLKAQVFLHGAVLNIKDAANEILGDKSDNRVGRIYVIRNGQVAPKPEAVPRKLSAIIGRSLSLMTKQAALNDLYRIFTFAQRDGLSFNYTDIPDDFEMENDEPFDREEMKRLFDIGYEMSLSDDAWRKKPPGFY